MANQKIKIEFQVLESKNPQFLLIGDLSVWEYSENLPANVLITLPGSSKPLVYSWKKNAINSFNSNNFGTTCVVKCDDQKYTDIPDGIYTITLKSGFEEIEQTHYYLKTDRFEVELSKIIVDNGVEYNPKDEDFRDNIFEIKWYLLEAKSRAHIGNFSEAARYFEEAQRMLRKYSQCKDCF